MLIVKAKKGKCSDCGAAVSNKLNYCPNCGSRVNEIESVTVPGLNRDFEEALFTARYEQRRYGLSPQQPEESDAAFIERVEREKTPRVVSELEGNV